MAQPHVFLSSLAPTLGPELDAFRSALQQPPTSGLRANTLKITPAALSNRLADDQLRPTPWCAAGFSVDSTAVNRPSLGKHPLHAAGLFYLQDPSAMAAAEWLAPQPGERVLDLCSAPGGKATHLAALMGDEGVLVANEAVPARAGALVENLERWGVRQALVTVETPARLAQHWPGFFDRILVDAPCSGEGMFRRQMADGAHIAWSPAQVEGCARRQHTILHAAAQLLRPGGWLLYSTCTFNTTENEGTVQQFLAEHPDFALVPGPFATGMAPGDRRYPGHQHMARLWPHRLAGEGHFLALMQRAGQAGPHNHDSPGLPPAAARPVQRVWEEFCRATLHVAPSGHVLSVGAYLYLWPEGAPAVAGLHVLRPGWWLGEVRHDRFVPSHALAMALPAAAFAQVVDLPAASPELTAYLRGEPLAQAGADGWLAVCVEGCALGWGKRTGNLVKNHYPKGLRSRQA